MADAIKVLDGKIAALRGLENVGDELAPEIGKIVDREIKQNIRAGLDPYGKRWERTKTGKQPLETAADGIRTDVAGRSIVTRITKRHLVLHHFGYARGDAPVRQILPSSAQVPRRIVEAIRRAFSRRMSRALGGDS